MPWSDQSHCTEITPDLEAAPGGGAFDAIEAGQSVASHPRELSKTPELTSRRQRVV